jgi:uncharacterized protein
MLAFEWDEAKARQNLAKHGVGFPFAARAFSDSRAVEGIDDTMHDGEQRYWMIGFADAVLLTIVYTERLGRIRLISARRATRVEYGQYASENGHD